eukprot:Skav230512  [mRNA]  locus=scaffold4943:18736:19878:+ [translate_table: standard]
MVDDQLVAKNLVKLKVELSQKLDNAVRHRDEQGARECLEEALQQWLGISVVTFSPLIDQAAQEGDLQRAEWWFQQAQLVADKIDQVEFNSLIHAAARNGNLSAAEAWFGRALAARIQPDTVSLTAVLRAANRDRAKDWFHAAGNLRISPNEVTHSCLLHALRRNATEVAEVFENMVEFDEVKPNVVMFNTVIDAVARAGDMEAAEQYFHRLCRMGRPDAATFGALINGAARQGDAEGASEWMQKMDDFGVARNVVIWNAFLKAFKHRPAEAEEMFEEMVRSNQQPDAVTLISLIGFLGKDRVREVCSELDVDYGSIIRREVVNRDVKRGDRHAGESEQYRRLSRFSMRAKRNDCNTEVPWYRQRLQQELSKRPRKFKDGT